MHYLCNIDSTSMEKEENTRPMFWVGRSGQGHWPLKAKNITLQVEVCLKFIPSFEWLLEQGQRLHQRFLQKHQCDCLVQTSLQVLQH